MISMMGVPYGRERLTYVPHMLLPDASNIKGLDLSHR